MSYAFPNFIPYEMAKLCALNTTNCFHIILKTILFQSAQFILTPQDNPLLTTCFYLESTILQENDPLLLLA